MYFLLFRSNLQGIERGIAAETPDGDGEATIGNGNGVIGDGNELIGGGKLAVNHGDRLEEDLMRTFAGGTIAADEGYEIVAIGQVIAPGGGKARFGIVVRIAGLIGNDIAVAGVLGPMGTPAIAAGAGILGPIVDLEAAGDGGAGGLEVYRDGRA